MHRNLHDPHCVTLLWMMILIQEADHALFWFCSLLSLFLSIPVISFLPSTDALMVWQLHLMLILSSSISVHNCVKFVHECVCVSVSVCALFMRCHRDHLKAPKEDRSSEVKCTFWMYSSSTSMYDKAETISADWNGTCYPWSWLINLKIHLKIISQI